MIDEDLLSQIRPGMAITVLGEPGSGKTGLSLRVAELLRKNYGLEIWIYGIPPENRKFYPPGIHFLDSIEDLSQAPSDAVLVYEELSLSAHSRRSMSGENILLGQLKNIRRHHNLTLICVCQRGNEMDKNLANSTQLLLIKRPEPFQHLRGSDRPQFEYHLKKAAELYKDPKIKRPECWVYVSTLEKLVQNALPSFWNEQISLSLGSLGSVGMRGRSKGVDRKPPTPFHQMKREEKIIEALILKMEGKSTRESGRILGVHQTTILNYWNNYPKRPQPLPDEVHEALRRQAKEEFDRRSIQQTPKHPEEEERQEPELEPVSARTPLLWALGYCQTGEHVFHEEDGRIRFCTECGTQVTWEHTSPSLAEQYRSEKAVLEDFRKRVDGKSGDWKEKLKVPAAVGVGVGVGAIPFFAIDDIDDAIDGTDWSEKAKSRAKWIARFLDLGFGIGGTAANVVPIVKGDAEWYSWGLLGVSVDQILISSFKMLEHAGVIGGGGVSERPIDWRNWAQEAPEEAEPKEPEEVEQTEEGVEEVEQTSGMKQTLDISARDADDILDTCKRVLDIVESDEISAEDKRDCMERALAMLESLEGCSILN